MAKLIIFNFKGDKKKFIAVTNFGATWIDDKNKFKTIFNKYSLKIAMNFLLNNSFLNFGKLSFQQIIVIPWVLTQNLSKLIYFFTAMRINGH